MSSQYDLKRDAVGWTVFDRWTGQPVVIELEAQSELSFADADALVQRLNWRNDLDDRTILQ
jgi:hypothetical protein